VNALELTGRARSHIVQLDSLRCALHRDVVEPFSALREAAAREGIDLRPYSSFRDFDTQVLIWNRKWRGERPLLDRDGQPLDHAALLKDQLVDAILGWSALPGASRHHWGSEIDVFDAAAVAADYRLQLVADEYSHDGPFARLNAWLDANLIRYGFFRPYDADRGGVHPEPWHISFAAVSELALLQLTPAILAEAIAASDMLGKQLVLQRVDQLHARFVANVGRPAPARIA
jgi:LAS superfamily LD-carboxypeptidase LdcB